MKKKVILAFASAALLITISSRFAISGSDKYTVRVPNGLAFADFRGYEDWQVVAVSQTDDLIKAMVANPTMIAAYRAGIPGNGKPFPDGSKIAKIEWKPKKNPEAPFSVKVPDTLRTCSSRRRTARNFPARRGGDTPRSITTPPPTSSLPIRPAR